MRLEVTVNILNKWITFNNVCMEINLVLFNYTIH